MFLKNKNIIFKIRRSRVTDYAALRINSFTTGVRELNGTSQISLVTHDAKGKMRELDEVSSGLAGLGWNRKIRPEDHRLASRGLPSDGKR